MHWLFKQLINQLLTDKTYAGKIKLEQIGYRGNHHRKLNIYFYFLGIILRVVLFPPL